MKTFATIVIKHLDLLKGMPMPIQWTPMELFGIVNRVLLRSNKYGKPTCCIKYSIMQHESTKATQTMGEGAATKLRASQRDESFRVPFLNVSYGMFAICVAILLAAIWVNRSGNIILHVFTLFGIFILLVLTGPWLMDDLPVPMYLFLYPIASTLIGVNVLSIVHAPWATVACYVLVSLGAWGLVNYVVGRASAINDLHVLAAILSWLLAGAMIVAFLSCCPPPMYYSPSIVTIQTGTKIEPPRLHQKTHGFLMRTIDHYLVTNRPLPPGLRFGQDGEIYGTPTTRLDEPSTVVISFSYGRMTIPCGEVTFLPSPTEAADRRYDAIAQSVRTIFDGVWSLLAGIKQTFIPSVASIVICLYASVAIYRRFM